MIVIGLKYLSSMIVTATRRRVGCSTTASKLSRNCQKIKEFHISSNFKEYLEMVENSFFSVASADQNIQIWMIVVHPEIIAMIEH